MLTRHAHNRRSRNRLLRGRSARRGGGGALTLRQQIAAVLGAAPQVYADARDLDLDDGDPVTVFGDFETSVSAGKTLDADGWADGLPLVELGAVGSPAWATETDVENYDAGVPLVWTFTGITVDDASNRSFGSVMLERNNAESNIYMGKSTTGACVFRTRATAGNQDSDTGLAIPANTPMHIGVAYDGETVTIGMVTDDGYDELLNTPHGIEASLTFDELMIGSSFGSAMSSWGIASFTRCSPENATPAKLQSVLNLHNQHYPVA